MAKYTRAEFLRISSAAAAGLGLVGLPACDKGVVSGVQASVTGPDLVLVNGRVLTMDDAVPKAELEGVGQRIHRLLQLTEQGEAAGEVVERARIPRGEFTEPATITEVPNFKRTTARMPEFKTSNPTRKRLQLPGRCRDDHLRRDQARCACHAFGRTRPVAA